MVRNNFKGRVIIWAVCSFLNCFANGVEVYLPPTKVGDLTVPATNLWTVLPCPSPEHEIYLPLGMPFGQSMQTNEVNSSEVVVVATISRVVLVGITDLDKINGQISYYRIVCNIKKYQGETFRILKLNLYVNMVLKDHQSLGLM